MPDKTVTRSAEKGSAAVRKPLAEARASRRSADHVHPAVAFARASSAPVSELSASDLLVLQRTAGNRAVAQILRVLLGRTDERSSAEGELIVGPLDEAYVKTPNPIAPQAGHQPQALPPQASSSRNAIQLKIEEPEEAEPLQRTVETVRRGENTTGLPDALKAGIENLSGIAMDDVKVHYNSPKPAQVQALAYTQGTDIYLAPGEEKHLPHEAWHVAQQKQGRVKPTLQAKLLVGAADDPYEQEADRVASEAMQRSEPSIPDIQRQPAPEEEDEEKIIQTKPLASSITPVVQRQQVDEDDEEETLVQRRSAAGVATVGPGVERSIEGTRSSGQRLPDQLRARMEPAFGADFSGVRVHADGESDRLNRSLGARAFTTGRDVFFRQGDYNPNSRMGQELIAHELTHVVQQGGGSTGNRGLAVRRAPGQLIQRSVADAIEEDRMAWKMMSAKSKAAMMALAPALGPFVQAWESGKSATGGLYNWLAGDRPGAIRKGLSGFAAGVLGAPLGAVYGLGKGLLRGLVFGIGNPLYSIGKRLANFSPSAARGIYPGDPRHEPGGRGRENYNYDTKTDLLNYGLLATGVGASVGKFVADRANIISAMPKPSNIGDVWDNTKTFFTDNTPVASETGTILSGLGAGASGLGALASLVDASKSYKESRDTANTTAQRGLGLAAGVGATLSSAQQAATSAYHIGNLTQNQAVALGAQTATGGLAVATGGVDILRGAYGYFKASSNIERLNRLERDRRLQGATRDAVQQAAFTQAGRKTSSAGTMLKGALSVAGGALFLASTATPIGWILLTAGALIGGIFALKKWWDKRKRKEAIAMKELGVVEERAQWEKDVAAVKKEHYWWSATGRARRAALGPDPLERELKANNFKDVGHFYAHYINRMANTLYDTAIADRTNLMHQAASQIAEARGDNRTFASLPRELIHSRRQADVKSFMKKEKIMIPEGNNYLQIAELIESMGLNFDWQANPVQPTPDKIGKALDH
jgi:hypothetical protein